MLLLNTCFVMRNTIKVLALRQLLLQWQEIINNHHNLVPPFWLHQKQSGRFQNSGTVFFLLQLVQRTFREPILSHTFPTYFCKVICTTGEVTNYTTENISPKFTMHILEQLTLSTFCIIFSFVKWGKPIHFTRFLNELIMKVFEL